MVLSVVNAILTLVFLKAFVMNLVSLPMYVNLDNSIFPLVLDLSSYALLSS